MKTPDNGIRGEMPATFMTIREAMAMHFAASLAAMRNYRWPTAEGRCDELAEDALVLADTLLAKLSKNPA